MSDAHDQVNIGLTVYNGGMVLVRDVRNVLLPSGELHLRFEDIAATVNPATVHLRSLSQPGQLPVLEQNYEYDLLDPQKLLQKYVGKEVTLVRTTMEAGATRTTEEIVTGISADHCRFPELPDTLYSRPTLVWSRDNTGPRAQRIEAAYLAADIKWSSDYKLTLDARGKSGDLDGWVTLQNNSGTALTNAKLQLIAGDLHKLEDDDPAVVWRLSPLHAGAAHVDPQRRDHTTRAAARPGCARDQALHRGWPAVLRSQPAAPRHADQGHRTEAWAARVTIPVAAGGETRVRSRVRVKW